DGVGAVGAGVPGCRGSCGCARFMGTSPGLCAILVVDVSTTFDPWPAVATSGLWRTARRLAVADLLGTAGTPPRKRLRELLAAGRRGAAPAGGVQQAG